MPGVNGYRDREMYPPGDGYTSYDPYRRPRDTRDRDMGGAYGTYDRERERERDNGYRRDEREEAYRRERDAYDQRLPPHDPYREVSKDELYSKVNRNRNNADPRGGSSNGAGPREARGPYRRASPPRGDPLAEIPKNYRVTNTEYAEAVMYDLDHLATFTVGSKQGLMYPEDGMKKLRQMELQTGIWTMRVQMIIEERDIVIVDRQTAEEMERFPLELVSDPTAVTSNERRDVYNNIVLFTVQEDREKRSPAEMHIFQVLQKPAQDVVDDIKESIRMMTGSHSRPPPPREEKRPVRDHIVKYEEESKRMVEATRDYQPGPNVRQEFRKSMKRPDDSETVITEKTDRDVELLNHCFDDIEKFVGRLQQAADAFKELDRRRRTRERPREKRNYGHGEGMLTMRARPPPAKDFIDIFQKFKLSFNLLAKLKPHIHDPNAPELVHFLFTPLSLVVEASKDPRHGTPDLATKVVSPLLSVDAKDLLLNCLTSKEADLWTSLGDAWTISRDQWKGYVPPYTPRFSDGWKPNSQWLESLNEGTIMRGSDEPRNRRSGGSDSGPDDYPRQSGGGGSRYDDYPSRYEQQSRYDDSRRDDSRRDDTGYYKQQAPPRSASPPPRDPYEQRGSGRRDFDRQQGAAKPPSVEAEPKAGPHDTFIRQLRARGSKIYQAIHDREGRNPKEITVRKGEIVEVLDDSRNWWKLRNARGEEGHAPYTILQEYSDSAVQY